MTVIALKKTADDVAMITQQMSELKTKSGRPYRPLCTATELAYSTLMRWRGRAKRRALLLQRAGPKPVAVLDIAGLERRLQLLAHGQQRSAGSGALYLDVRGGVSRRAFQAMVRGARRAARRADDAGLQRIDWRVAGAVWSIDPTEMIELSDGQRTKRQLLPVMDLASRYKFLPLIGAGFNGQQVAQRLDELFRRHGAPLVLKRDNGSNLNDAAVNEVLARHWVIPLNSPCRYPPYNGGIEWSQREIKTALRPHSFAALEAPGVIALALHELNHKSRRCLKGNTACHAFAAAKSNLRPYTRRRRKEIFEEISDWAMQTMQENPVRTQAQTDAAWRRSVETWLLREGVIAFAQPKTVTQLS